VSTLSQPSQHQSQYFSYQTNSVNLTKSNNDCNVKSNSVFFNNNINNLVHRPEFSSIVKSESNSQVRASHQQAFTSFVVDQQSGSSGGDKNKKIIFSESGKKIKIGGQESGSNMPKNEPVKLVYPNTQASSIGTMNNNRVTFSSAPVQNGTIITQMTANQLTQPNQQQQATVMQQRGGQQTPTLIFKNPNNMQPVSVSKANSQVRMHIILFLLFSRSDGIALKK
jgi:hypothetical protein